MIAEFNLSEKAERELLQTVLLIAQNFVDRAYGQDATQLAVDSSYDTKGIAREGFADSV